MPCMSLPSPSLLPPPFRSSPLCPYYLCPSPNFPPPFSPLPSPLPPPSSPPSLPLSLPSPSPIPSPTLLAFLLCDFSHLAIIIFSDEYNRVKLNFMRGVDGSDYINASFIDVSVYL